MFQVSWIIPVENHYFKQYYRMFLHSVIVKCFQRWRHLVHTKPVKSSFNYNTIFHIGLTSDVKWKTILFHFDFWIKIKCIKSRNDHIESITRIKINQRPLNNYYGKSVHSYENEKKKLRKKNQKREKKQLLNEKDKGHTHTVNCRKCAACFEKEGL